MISKRVSVYLMICTAVALWGLSFIWTNQLLVYHIPVFTLIFTRLVLAAVVMLLIGKIGKRIQPIKNKDIKWFLLLATLEPFIYFIGETFGMKYTASPSLSSVIISSIPIFGLLAGIAFYKEKVTVANILGIIVTLPGLFLVVFGKWDFTLGAAHGLPGTNLQAGILLLFLAVFSAVGYSVVVKKIAADYSPFTITMYQHGLGAVYFLPFVLSYDIQNGTLSHITFGWNFWYPVLMLAIFCSGIAFVFFITCIKELGVSKASTFNALIPIITAGVCFIMGIETFRPVQLAGIIIVVTGVILSQSRSRRS